MVEPLPRTSKEVPTWPTYIQYKGVWDMQDLYEFVASFFSKNKFKFYEKRYIVKHPGPFGPEPDHQGLPGIHVKSFHAFPIRHDLIVFPEDEKPDQHR